MTSEKSPDAFRTISEVADDLDLPQHVLRFWETRFNQIKPMKRGGGRRYYRPGDVDLLRGIRHLLYEEGYTIKGVQKILRENGNQFAIAIGTGDLSALQEMTKRTAASEAHSAQTAPRPQPTATPPARAADPAEHADDDVVLGAVTTKARGFFSRTARGGDSKANDADDGASLSRDNRALLQEALFDLLECKRLLDQSRS